MTATATSAPSASPAEAGPVTIEPADERLDEIGRLLDDYRDLDALHALEALGPIDQWTGRDRIRVAGTLNRVGASREALRQTLLAWREQPESLCVMTSRAREISEYGGVYEEWRFLKSHAGRAAAAIESKRAELSGVPDDDRRVQELNEAIMYWRSRFVFSLTELRDFTRAADHLDLLTEENVRPEVVHAMRAHWLMRQDRYDDALEATAEALTHNPRTRSAMQMRGHLLSLLDRDDEAYDLLVSYAEKVQVAAVWYQIGTLDYERQDFAATERRLDRYEELSPRLERHLKHSLRILRAHLAMQSGDEKRAVELARAAKSKFGHKMADRIEDPKRQGGERTILPVRFIRQHDRTCAPATLAMLARYWGREAEHLEVAEEVCYNGTTTPAQVKWCEQNDYVTKLFTVTEEVTRQLIEAGVPFTLATQHVVSGHLQAICGYDGRTGSLILRDPYERLRNEAFADEFLEKQQATGPLGSVMLPPDEIHRIDGIELPDSELHEARQNIARLLNEHRRDEAVAELESLRQAAPDHFLRHWAECDLAYYDTNSLRLLDAVDELLKQFPEDEPLRMRRRQLLRQLGRREQRLQEMEEAADDNEVHPYVRLQLAEELALDVRTHDRAEELFRESIRRMPGVADGYAGLGRLVWSEHHRDEGRELFRFAACLEERDESHAETYFHAATATGRREIALDWLRGRFDRFAAQSRMPTMTLFTALASAGRHTEAAETLEEAMRRRPDDPELKLAAASALSKMSSANWPRATALLEEAKEGSSRVEWGRTASHLAMLQGDYERAEGYLSDLVEEQPLSVGLHAEIADLLLRTQGEEAARAHWKTWSERFPHFEPFAVQYIQTLRGEPFEMVEPVLQAALDRDPDDAWALRELAIHGLIHDRLDQVEELLARSRAIDPDDETQIGLEARLLRKRGDREAARGRLRDLLRQGIDDEQAMGELLACCDTAEQRREELRFVASELKRQPVAGDGLLGFLSLASPLLEADELDAVMVEALDARPDLPAAWRARMRHLLQADRLDEAAELADRAVEEFPLLRTVWLDRAEIAAARGDQQTQWDSLQASRELSPNSGWELRVLSDIAVARDDYDTARELIDEAVSLEPTQGTNRGFLADVLLKLKEYDAALEEFEQAVSLTPGYGWAWSQFEALARFQNQPERPLETAKAIAERRPDDPDIWERLALLAGDDHELGEHAIAQLERLAPASQEVVSLKADRLVHAGRFEEALALYDESIAQLDAPRLRFNKAHLLWDLGRRDAGRAEMQRLVDEDPGLLPAWRSLLAFAQAAEDRDGALEASRQIVRLSPHDADTLGNAGDLLEQLEDYDAAVDAFEKAVRIDPMHTSSRISLADRYIAADRWDDAKALLTDVPRHDGHPLIRARRVQIAVHENDYPAALEQFGQIVRDEDANRWAVGASLEELAADPWNERAAALVDEAIADGEAAAAVGWFWMDRLLEKKALAEVAPPLRELAERIGPGGEDSPAHAAVQRLIGEWEKDHAAAARFIDGNRETLSIGQIWGLVAYFFSDTAQSKKGLDWVSDWASRDVEPWVLTNVHEIFRNDGQHAEGAAVTAAALELPPDHCHIQHRYWGCFDALERGDLERAVGHYMAIDVDDLPSSEEFILDAYVGNLMRTLLTEDRAAGFAHTKDVWADLRSSDLIQETMKRPVLRHLRTRCAAMMAEMIGGLGPKLWAWKVRLRGG